jgi:hypothetical protein
MAHRTATPPAHAPHHARQAAPARKELWGVLAEFPTPAAIYHAAEAVRDAGYTNWDCHTPFPVHGLDRAMGVKMTRLGLVVFACGLTGCLLGVLLQWYTNAAPEGIKVYAPMSVETYPYAISGKPEWSLPANIPVIFELTVLFSAFGAVFGMLGMNRLPRLHHPLFTSRRFLRVTNDRFFIAIERDDPNFDEARVTELLRSNGAVAVERIED